MGSALLDCWSSVHRLHWSASGVESVAVGFRVWINKLLPATIVPQIGCPFSSVHWNWYCLVTAALGSSQTERLAVELWKSHWNSTTTETKEDVFIRFPAASHTNVKFIILTGTLAAASPWGTMARATSPLVENSVVLPRSWWMDTSRTAHLKSRLVLAISLRIDRSTWFFLSASLPRLVSRAVIMQCAQVLPRMVWP